MQSKQFIGPAEAASRLGISPKALRLYEQRGVVEPIRSEAGWRAYGPAQMARLGEVVALRSLGLSLRQVKDLLGGDNTGLEPVLGAHQGALEAELKRIGAAVESVRAIRQDLVAGNPLPLADLMGLAGPSPAPVTTFELPWPWGGERFELRDVRPINYIVGPLGSGKTRFAMKLAEVLPDARFLGLDRNSSAGRAAMVADPTLKARVNAAIDWLVDEGADASDALITLLASIYADGLATVVVDMVEQGLAQATQEALAAYFRGPGIAGRTLFLMTRSSALLDLAALGPREAIFLCPANHSPPTRVLPYPGAPGYETIASCLAAPEVRARTDGVVATQSRQ